MSTRWEQELEERRQQRIEDIVSVAQEVFLEKGLIETTMREISERSRLSKVSIYKYFTSLHELAFEVQFNALRKMKEVIGSFGPEGGSKGQIKRTLMGLFRFSSEFPSYVRYIAMFDYAYRDRYPTEELARRYRDVLNAEIGNSSELVAMVEESQKYGEIRADVSAKVLVDTVLNSFLSMTERMVVRSHLLSEEGHAPANEELTLLMDILLEYLNPRRPHTNEP